MRVQRHFHCEWCGEPHESETSDYPPAHYHPECWKIVEAIIERAEAKVAAREEVLDKRSKIEAVWKAFQRNERQSSRRHVRTRSSSPLA